MLMRYVTSSMHLYMYKWHSAHGSSCGRLTQAVGANNNSLKCFVQHHAHACITILYSPIGPSHNDRIDIMMKTVDYNYILLYQQICASRGQQKIAIS